MSVARRRQQLTPQPTLSEANYDHTSRRRQRQLDSMKASPSKLGNSAKKYAARLESLRASPYMFFHGENNAYEQAVVTRDAQQTHWEELSKDRSVKMPVAPPPVHPTLLDNIFDDLNSDGFAGGQVNDTIGKLRERKKKTKAVLTNEALELDYGFNTTVLRKHLLRIASLESMTTSDGTDSIMLVVRVDALRKLLLHTYEVANAVVVDMFCREISKAKDGNGVVTFASLIELFNAYTNLEQAVSTARACFRIFDPNGSDVLAHGALKRLRGVEEHDMPPGQNQGNAKALLDMWQHTPGLASTVTIDEFPAIFVDSATLAEAFMEELLRQVLVVKFEHNRTQLVAAPKKASSLPSIHNPRR
jgi:hypothetical protein